MRRRVGCVDHARVTRTEFYALLQLLVPEDGSAPNIRKAEARVQLSDVVGAAHLFRMQARHTHLTVLHATVSLQFPC